MADRDPFSAAVLSLRSEFMESNKKKIIKRITSIDSKLVDIFVGL